MSQGQIDVDRIACLPGNQGARSSAGNQAENEKCTTGINRNKRHRTSSGECEELDCPTQTIWPRFIIITSKEQEFQCLSSIAISKDLKEKVGDLKNIRRLLSGSFQVECYTRYQSDTLLKTEGHFLQVFT